MAQIIDGRRGGKILIHNGYLYQKNKVRPNGIYWRCESNNCRVPLRTKTFDVHEPPNNIVVNNVGNHNHNPRGETISHQMLLNEVKDNVNDPSAPLRCVYDDFMVTVTRRTNGPPVADIHVFHHIQSQMKRAKYKNVPPIPEDVDNVVINGV